MPTSLRIASGNRSRTPLPDAEPVVDTSLPVRPDHLPPAAVIEWDRIIPIMDSMGVLSSDSGPAVAGYCVNHARIVAAAADIAEHGIVLEDANGHRRVNPAVNVENKCAALILRFLAEFGMTPSARAGVRSNRSANAENDLDAFILRKRSPV